MPGSIVLRVESREVLQSGHALRWAALAGIVAGMSDVVDARDLKNPDVASCRAVLRLPHPVGSLRIGLLGGSFNPAHAGHRHISLLALQRLRLDRVWWLVSPGNPLKAEAGLAPVGVRLAEARRVAAHPRVLPCDLETSLGTRYTYDLLSRLVARCPDARFVWIMGGDNLLQFDRWRRWRDIAALVPIAVIDRPGSTWRAAHSRAGIAFAGRRIDEVDAGLLADCEPPVLTIIHGPRSRLSSTAVRAGRAEGELAVSTGAIRGRPASRRAVD